MAEPYRGERWGLPAQGPGSVPGLGLRVLALFLDWGIAYFLARVVTSPDTSPQNPLNPGPLDPGPFDPGFALIHLAAFFLQVALFTWLVGGSMAQRFLRLRVIALPGGGRLDLRATLIRTALILLVLPAAVYDADGRGLHDRVARSIVVRG